MWDSEWALLLYLRKNELSADSLNFCLYLPHSLLYTVVFYPPLPFLLLIYYLFCVKLIPPHVLPFSPAGKIISDLWITLISVGFILSLLNHVHILLILLRQTFSSSVSFLHCYLCSFPLLDSEIFTSMTGLHLL